MYTTHGLMTAADYREYLEDHDMLPEPITIEDLARELGTDVDTLLNFDATLPPYTGPDMLVDAEDADAIREAWESAEDTDNPECEAKGCDIPEGYSECRRCGTECVD